MEETELEKYILEQAKIEVEHTRSWPTKVMAFYIAINFGITGTLISLKQNKCCFSLPDREKWVIESLIALLSLWVVGVLIKNHRNYIKYRNVQVRFQKNELTHFKDKFGLPDEWFKTTSDNIFQKGCGWGLYAFIVLIVVVLMIYAVEFIV